MSGSINNFESDDFGIRQPVRHVQDNMTDSAEGFAVVAVVDAVDAFFAVLIEQEAA